MLHFKKMTLKNFGPYKGEQIIDFTDKSGVTIFWGNNGRGKTTLLNAFRYALFGVVQRRNGPLKNLSEMENSESAVEGHHGFSVVLEMTNDDDYYRLTRQLSLRDGVTSPTGEEDYEKSTFLSKNGALLSPDDREHELNMIMPEQVSRFFLFDAELLQEYEELLEVDTADGAQIKDAIEKILGVPVLKNGVEDLDYCVSKYDQMKARAARADNKTNQLGVEMESLNANIEQHQNNIRDQEAKLSDLYSHRNIIEGQMKETEKLRNWIIQKNETEKHQKKAEDNLANIKAKLRALLKEAWRGMLLTTIRDVREEIESEAKTLDSKKQKRTVANHFIMEIKQAVAERTCPVCGQNVGPDIIVGLNAKINASTSEFSGLTEEENERLYRLRSSLSDAKHLSDDVRDVKSDVALLEEQIEKFEIDISKDRTDIAEWKDDIRRYGVDAGENDVLSLTKKHSDIDRSISDIRSGIDAEKKKLQECKDNKEKISKAIDKQAGGTDYRVASRRYDLCHHLYQIFDESKTMYRERLKKNVEKDATDLFRQLTSDHDYVGLKINDNYGLVIIHKSGRTVPGRSSGYEHIVALSLIGALHKNAPLRGPIIMDSPFGRLDPANKANIVRTLPGMAEQSMLLAYVGEINPQVARQQLGPHLLHEYNLERVSSMHTEIK